MKRKPDKTIPEKIEQDIYGRYTDIEQRLASILEGRESGCVEDWPEWCYVPMAFSYGITTKRADEAIAQRYLAVGGMDDFHKMSAIVPWSVSKTVYRFDPDLANELMEQETQNELPANVLLSIPYPCIYIENPPGLDGCDGVFFFLEYDYRYPQSIELRCHYVFSDGEIIADFYQWYQSGLEDEVQTAMMENAIKVHDNTNEELLKRKVDNRFTKVFAVSPKHLNMLLYLCSDEPDIAHKENTPPPKKSKNKRIVAYPDEIKVGAYIGSTIRKWKQQEAQERGTSSGESETMRASVRPHMRKAHWHLYWTGVGKTIPRVKWVMSVFVGKGEEIPTVIRPVK